MSAQLSHFFARAAAMLLLCACVLLAGIYPHHPRGPAGWGLFLFLAAPVVMGLEHMGTLALQNRVMRGLPRAGRLVFGVVTILTLAALIYPVWQWSLPYMDTW
jgi:hypothetical protein